jgi:hypothetical protein
MLLRFVEGRPVSAVTEAYLEWVSQELFQAGKQALLLVWDNASWHDIQPVCTWLWEHNREVKRGEQEGVRIVVCWLPKRSPWLNPIGPKWLHGKRAMAEPERVPHAGGTEGAGLSALRLSCSPLALKWGHLILH